MTTTNKLFTVFAAVSFILAGTATAQVDPNPNSPLKNKKVLILEGTYQSHVQSRANAHANLVAMQAKIGFKLDVGDNTKITDAYLAPYDIVVFNYFFDTQDQISAAGQTAFAAWLAKGNKGYIGYHTSGANEWSKQEWPWYQNNVTSMRYNVFHPDVPDGTINRTTDATVLANPIMAGLPASWTAADEWYEYDALATTWGQCHFMYYLQNPDKVGVGRIPAPIHPVAWYREDAVHSRYFYATFGHQPAAALDPFFKSIVLRALEYTSGDPTTSALNADGQSAMTMKDLSYITASREVNVTVQGDYRLSVWSPQGKMLWSTAGQGARAYAPPAFGKPGLYIVKVESNNQKLSQRIMVY